MKKILIYVLIVVVLCVGFIAFSKINIEKEIESPEVASPEVGALNVEKKMDSITSVLSEKENVENYLKKNITALSPIPAVLGGTWQVLSFTIDVNSKTGTVLYEDGHLSENRKFRYVVNQNGEVLSLTIK